MATALALALPHPTEAATGQGAPSGSAAGFGLFLPPYLAQQRVAAIHASPHPANKVVVSNCDDTGPGSLRASVVSAAEGDTVDMSSLTCSTITLYSGAITINQNNLTLTGSGANTLAITGAYAYHAYELDRIINHVGTGILTVADLSVSYGAPYSMTSAVHGGCIASAGSVYLKNAVVTRCTAKTNGLSLLSDGGGVYAAGYISLVGSIVENSRTLAVGSASYAFGGGVFAGTGLLCNRCSIESNLASATGSAIGGGAYARTAKLEYSTISGNQASIGGGIVVRGANFELFDSTVSGNRATQKVGGVYSATNTMVYYSTIAFNTVISGTSQPNLAPGLTVRTNGPAFTVTLNNALISNNTYGTSTENDFSVDASGGGSVTVTGGGNLIRTTFSSVPNDTITGACPDLGPLRDNDGPTKTHALLSHSPAIDRGHVGTFHPAYDQRGPGPPIPHLRVSGPAPDICAYEVQQNDIVFNNGFDGCP
ncbi:MAG: choice-of-anchor Q domain-containing protein [Caldimonas sp.]